MPGVRVPNFQTLQSPLFHEKLVSFGVESGERMRRKVLDIDIGKSKI